MGKSKANSKILRRLRASKRALAEELLVKPKLERLHQKIMLSRSGFEYRPAPKQNAFLEPDNPNAVFPQTIPTQPLDFRSNKNPYSGTEMRRNQRKSKSKNVISVKTAGDLGNEAGELEKILKASKKTDKIENEQALISKLINMKLLEDQYGKNRIQKRLSKKGPKRRRKNLKNTRRAVQF